MCLGRWQLALNQSKLYLFIVDACETENGNFYWNLRVAVLPSRAPTLGFTEFIASFATELLLGYCAGELR